MWQLDPSPRAATHLRHELAATLEAAGLSEDAREAVLLVANELVANAVEHARTPIQVMIVVASGHVRVQVRDGSPAEPQIQPFDVYADRGRGLQVVEQLATRWNWNGDGAGGKTVWAEIPMGWHPDPPR